MYNLAIATAKLVTLVCSVCGLLSRLPVVWEGGMKALRLDRLCHSHHISIIILLPIP
jgi:hypothetical protein